GERGRDSAQEDISQERGGKSLRERTLALNRQLGKPQEAGGHPGGARSLDRVRQKDGKQNQEEKDAAFQPPYPSCPYGGWDRAIRGVYDFRYGILLSRRHRGGFPGESVAYTNGIKLRNAARVEQRHLSSRQGLHWFLRQLR